jgi:hypothetical protein
MGVERSALAEPLSWKEPVIDMPYVILSSEA